MLEDYIQYCPNRDAVRVFGIPKFDSIYEKRAELDSYIKCKVKEKRVILWKMHFPKLIYEGNIRKQVTPYLLHYIKFAEVIEQYKDVFFVVMPHPLFFSHTIDPILAKESGELFDILKEKPNVIIDMDSDYRKTLYNADAIIVDRSALMVEAGLCGVPVLYMKNVDYEEPLTKAVEGLVNAYEHGINTDDMNNFVKKFQAGELCVETQKILAVKEREFGYVDGKCGERILSDIKNGIIEAENPRIKVVFFGASFICDHYLKKLDIMNNIHFEVIALSDNNMEKWGAARNGIAVIPPEKLKYISFDILVITSEQYYLPIKKKLVYELYIEEEKVLRLDRFVEKYFESREEE